MGKQLGKNQELNVRLQAFFRLISDVHMVRDHKYQNLSTVKH